MPPVIELEPAKSRFACLVHLHRISCKAAGTGGTAV